MKIYDIGCFKLGQLKMLNTVGERQIKDFNMIRLSESNMGLKWIKNQSWFHCSAHVHF